jgi:branched-chain amino acid transport system ATP-binding protein
MSFAEITRQSQDSVKSISLLSVDKISKRFDSQTGVSDLSLNIGGGEIVGLIGKKGSGKTTILDLISGYLSPNSGRIFFAGHDVTALPSDTRQARGLARSIEAAGVFPDFTLSETIAFGRSATRWPLFPRRGGKSEEAEARDLLGMIGLADFAERRAAMLTTAQRRVLGIAAALASKPSLLLLDLSPEDNYFERMRIGALLAGAVGSGISVLVTSHQMCPIIAMCDRAAVVSDGKIVAEGAPERVVKKSEVVRNYLRRLHQRIRYGHVPFADGTPRPA